MIWDSKVTLQSRRRRFSPSAPPPVASAVTRSSKVRLESLAEHKHAPIRAELDWDSVLGLKWREIILDEEIQNVRIE